jgi:hypothetical protein
VASPPWLDDGFAAVMAVVAVYSLGRLVAARAWSRPTHPDVDLAHVLMGTAMVGMLVSDLDPVPHGVWEVVFTALALWFVWRCVRFVTEHGVEGRDEDHVHHLSHYLTHLVMACSMLYMFLAAEPPPGTGGGMAMGPATGSTTEFVGLPLLFLVVLFASGVWELDGIGRFAPRPAPVVPTGLALAVTGGTGAPGTGDGGEADAGAPWSSPGVGDRARSPGGRWLAPRLEAGCHVAMCVTMGFMLVLML